MEQATAYPDLEIFIWADLLIFFVNVVLEKAENDYRHMASCVHLLQYPYKQISKNNAKVVKIYTAKAENAKLLKIPELRCTTPWRKLYRISFYQYICHLP